MIKIFIYAFPLTYVMLQIKKQKIFFKAQFHLLHCCSVILEGEKKEEEKRKERYNIVREEINFQL